MPIASKQTNYSPLYITPLSKAMVLNSSKESKDVLSFQLDLDNSIEEYSKFTLNFKSNIILGAGVALQNIAATSTIPIYILVNYIITQGPLAGKWLIRWRLDYIPPIGTAPSPLYDGHDPVLQTAQVLVPNSGNNVFSVSNFELKNRRCHREEPYAGETLEAGVLTEEDGFLIIEDASKLFFHSGYFEVAPYFASFDSRKVLGAGVTDTDINNLVTVVSMSISALPALRS